MQMHCEWTVLGEKTQNVQCVAHANNMVDPRLSFEESVAICKKVLAASRGVVPDVPMLGCKRTMTFGGEGGEEGTASQPRMGRLLYMQRVV